MTTMPRLPDPLTPETIEELMKARPYWDLSLPRSPLYRRLVQRGFEIMYPDTRFDAIGRMIDDPPQPPERIAHLVAETNQEMERALGADGEASDWESQRGGGAVHVQSHSRDGGKVEVADYWRAAPGEGSDSESDRDPGRDTETEEDQSPQTADSGGDLPPMTNPVPGGRIRGDDGPPYGSGDFGASRGGRRHDGVDVEAEPGTSVVSPVSGRVTIGDPYDDDPVKRRIYQSVRIETEDGSVVKVFYVKPGAAIQNGVLVKAGQPIGTAQDLSKIYPPKDGGRMTNHVHVEVWKNDRRRNPTGVLFPNKQ